ncbi:hypothetical protein BV22DRAFT_1012631 [Leucogyrophana mollusca]|uniref:Uncharacterized protein n=1 Tax=Leucogyrophana mollusca TaxID=85980 RepID=A0ACB8BG94_9AGAM|nr:hypothetical protein BV22DRAFT_1012631 [Leucogyrophana mollusca]
MTQDGQFSDVGLPKARHHPTYWFSDGSLIVRVRTDNDTDTLFKVHSNLIRRHSRYVQCIVAESSPGDVELQTISIPPELGLRIEDFTALLEHLYHDSPLSPEAPFPHVAAILRATCSDRLDMPAVHSLAQSYFTSMFPSGPTPFTHPNHLEEALALATTHQIPSVRKGIFYSLVTTSDFEPDESELTSPVPSGSPAAQSGPTVILPPLSQRHVLPPADVDRCRNLMTGIVEHFTPILFTPPATPHMACTDVFADKWMLLVIQPALTSDGVYKPLEMLEEIKAINWEEQGLCPACVREKREEWTQEQVDVWKNMDAWL